MDFNAFLEANKNGLLKGLSKSKAEAIFALCGGTDLATWFATKRGSITVYKTIAEFKDTK